MSDESAQGGFDVIKEIHNLLQLNVRGTRMNDNDKRTTRAAIIQKLAVAPIAIGALAALRAEADAAATVDQKAAAYQTTPNGGKQCSGCSLFIPAKSAPMKSAGTCKLVKGSISPHGWCKFYTPKAH